MSALSALGTSLEGMLFITGTAKQVNNNHLSIKILFIPSNPICDIQLQACQNFFSSFLFCFLFSHLPALGKLYPVHSIWPHSEHMYSLCRGAGATRRSSASSCYIWGTDTLLLLLCLRDNVGCCLQYPPGKTGAQRKERKRYKCQLKSNFVNGRTTYVCNLGTSSSVSCPKRRSVSLLKGEQQVYTALLLEDINPFQPCK